MITVLRVRLTVEPLFDWNDRVHGTTPDPSWFFYKENRCRMKSHTRRRWSQCFWFFRSLKRRRKRSSLRYRFSSRYRRNTSSAPYRIVGSAPKRSPLYRFSISSFPNAHGPSQLAAAARDGARRSVPRTALSVHALQSHTNANLSHDVPTFCWERRPAVARRYRVFREYPGQKVVYIAPLKALVRERMSDWRNWLQKHLGKKCTIDDDDVKIINYSILF